MQIYAIRYQAGSNQDVLQPVFFSRENASRQLQELADKRIEELKPQMSDVHPHYIDGERADIYIGKNLSETFEMLALETEDIGYTAESILRKESFPVTCVSKEDLESSGFDTSSVTDSQMERLADKLGDDYVEQTYWGSLDILAEGLDIPYKPDGKPSDDDPLAQMLPQDGSEVDISDRDDAPSWTFYDDDGNAYTDRATAVRLRDGKVEVRWEGERYSHANWEPLEWIWDDGDYINFENDLTECVKDAVEENKNR